MEKQDAPSTVHPSSGETHGFTVADDGTRLFTHSRSAAPPEPGEEGALARLAAEQGVRAFFNDGILCDGFIWKYLWDQITSIMAVTHWHYRGHGRSAKSKDPGRVDIASLADDLESVARGVGDPPRVLFGHSMGTQVCLEAYRRHPERVRGLVLCCGSFGRVTSSFRGVPILDFLLPKVTELAQKSPELVRALWSRIPPDIAMKMARKAGDVDRDKIRDEDLMPYLQHMTHVDFPMFLRMLRGAGDHSAEDYLADIRVPVLIVAGEKDTFTPASLSSYMAERIPGAKLALIGSGSHVAPIEQPDLVFSHVRAFLESVLGAGDVSAPR